MNLGGMDIVYILGKGSMWRNNELRYSLRSLKNIEHRKVFIVGYLPKFVRSDRVVHVPLEDQSENKILNAIVKHKAICSNDEISQDFILMHDDIFLLKEIVSLPRWYRSTLRASIENHPTKDGYYYKSMVLTEQILKMQKIENPFDYSIHAPFIFNKKKLNEVLELCDKFVPNPLLIRTVYGNYFWRKSEQHDDVKATHERHLEELEKESFISISDNLALRTGFRFWIDRKFQVPSHYEVESVQDDMGPEETSYTAPNGANIDDVYYSPGTIIRNKKISPEVVLAQGLKVID